MKFIPKQCKECPFRPESLPMWLGAYTPGEVFSAVWKGDPFFCHPTIDYEDLDWLAKAMDHGKLCTGGLLFAKLICAPDHEIRHEPIRSARLKVLKIEKEISCMTGREFAAHHSEENFKTWKGRAPVSIRNRRRRR